MEKLNFYLRLAHYILPEEIASSFDSADVKEAGKDLRLYPDGKEEAPAGYEISALEADGFYEVAGYGTFPFAIVG